MSGGVWSMTMADALVVVALVLLFIEIMKSTRTSNRSIVDHVLSLFVFVAFRSSSCSSRARRHPSSSR
jgi:2-keto-4-pentenoate hydratase